MQLVFIILYTRTFFRIISDKFIVVQYSLIGADRTSSKHLEVLDLDQFVNSTRAEEPKGSSLKLQSLKRNEWKLEDCDKMIGDERFLLLI